MRAIFLECCKHYNFSPFSERSAAARGVGKFVPNHVNIVCRLIYLFILLSYIWKIGNCVIFPTLRRSLKPSDFSNIVSNQKGEGPDLIPPPSKRIGKWFNTGLGRVLWVTLLK